MSYKERIISRKDVWEKLKDPKSESRKVLSLAHSLGYLIHLRHNYFNIYYRGISMLKISFDRNAMPVYYVSKGYFSEEDPNSGELLELLHNKPSDYFSCMKKIMDGWSKRSRHRHNEKETQQRINKDNFSPADSDYTVIDLEYAIGKDFSFCLSEEYKVQYKRDHKGKDPGAPRYDIVAIDNENHQLVVFELKDGNGATLGSAGVKEHAEKFENSLGKDKDRCFVKEMSAMVKQLQELGLLDDKIQVNTDLPAKFMFIFRGSPKEKKTFEDTNRETLKIYHPYIYLNRDDANREESSKLIKP